MLALCHNTYQLSYATIAYPASLTDQWSLIAFLFSSKLPRPLIIIPKSFIYSSTHRNCSSNRNCSPIYNHPAEGLGRRPIGERPKIISYDFSCRIVRLYQYLTEDAEYKELIMSKQAYRSGTSIGANVREAQHSQSEADFLSKMSIAYKEADESNYWINLLHDNGYLTDAMFTSLDSDNQRILRLLASIVKSTKEKIAKTKAK